MKQLQQRSSWSSSMMTGMIGWLGWLFIGPLIFNLTISTGQQPLIALASATVQIVVLRLLFFVLQMQRGLWIGASWGILSAVGLYYIARLYIPVLQADRLYWLLVYSYIGGPVGAFLSYFYRDDQKIHSEQGVSANANYGRDAHWLEPFAFGVAAYLIAFHPFTDVSLLINVLITGVISGIAAAGASHFSPDEWKCSYLLLLLLAIVPGSIQGALTGLLFRHYPAGLVGNYILKGIIAGVLTYLLTFLRGRQLVFKKGLL